MEKRISKIDRKAWIRILEVFLAILLIVGSMLVIISRKAPETDISDSIYKEQRQILDIISKNDSLRNDIIINSNTRVNEAISKIIPNSWNFTTNICNINDICDNPAYASDSSLYEKNIYATEVLVTSNLTYYNPKKLRFFVWMK
ncbi:MAG: hypothetical protein PHH54_04900 [Candidatus Nanoarchaeia archaeon]|nr:hypothetical protein [Candidatus Nanoarchaeia archaeon]MDD5741296.1 hypothetical protein [Candidatus Nanoarchaeia archaeon]